MNAFKKDNKMLMKSKNINDKLVLNDKLKNLHSKLNVIGHIKKFMKSNEIVGDCKHYSDIKAKVIKCYDKGEYDFDTENRCCCGKEGLKYLYIVKFENKKSLLVGSECIKKYENDDMNDKVKELKTLKEYKMKLNEDTRGCYKCKGGLCAYHKKVNGWRKKKIVRFCSKGGCKALINNSYKKCFNCKK